MKGTPAATDIADRRVRRSRSALMSAAVALVSERGTADISVSDIADAADVSRQLLYQHFGDRDALLLAAAVDLAERELLPQIGRDSQIPAGKDRLLALVLYFARHRPFYRAMLSNSRAHELLAALNAMLGPFSQRLIDRLWNSGLKPQVVQDLTLFVTGGWTAMMHVWLIEAPEPLDADAFTERLLDLMEVILGTGTTRLSSIWAQASARL